MPDDPDFSSPALVNLFLGSLEGGLGCVVLVVAGGNLDGLARLLLEQNEIVDVLHQHGWMEQRFNHVAEFHVGCRLIVVHAPPRHEAVPPGGEGTKAGVLAVGNNEQLVGFKQHREFLFVRLKLLETVLQVDLFPGEGFEFKHADGKPVEVEHDVGFAEVSVEDDLNLIHDEEVVVGGVFPVDQPNGNGVVAAGGSFVHADAFDQHFLEHSVAFGEVGLVSQTAFEGSNGIVEHPG